jgi:hypothetical protein
MAAVSVGGGCRRVLGISSSKAPSSPAWHRSLSVHTRGVAGDGVWVWGDGPQRQAFFAVARYRPNKDDKRNLEGSSQWPSLPRSERGNALRKISNATVVAWHAAASCLA